VISDPCREAADFGAPIEWFDDQPPALVESRALLADKAKLLELTLPDPAEPGRMKDRVDGVRLLAEKVGTDLVVEGWVEGPCAMAADLRGVNTLMLDFTDDPQFVLDLFAYVVEMELRFARAQVEAGALLIGIGDAAASLIGPRRYEQFVLPYEGRLLAGIRAMGARTRLHICGNTRKILHRAGETQPDMIDIDYPVPLHEARAALGDRQVIAGNLDPVRAVRDGTPETITRGLDECRRVAGRHFIVAAGCEIPRGTPPENLLAMTAYAKSHGG
jgi:MtaA/CmuA family methyltransferase